jgi:hypothetical protein
MHLSSLKPSMVLNPSIVYWPYIWKCTQFYMLLSHHDNDHHKQYNSGWWYYSLGPEERCLCFYRSVRCFFDFNLLRMYRILDTYIMFTLLRRRSNSIKQNRMNNISQIKHKWTRKIGSTSIGTINIKKNHAEYLHVMVLIQFSFFFLDAKRNKNLNSRRYDFTINTPLHDIKLNAKVLLLLYLAS